MRITIEEKNNAIHSYLSVEIQDPTSDALPLIKQILDIVESYNKSEIDEA